MATKINPDKIGSRKARNRAARLVAVQSVYDMMISGNSASKVLAGYRDHRYGVREEGIDFVPADLELLAAIVRGVDARRVDLVDMVQGALDTRAGTSQPEALLRATLLCGAYEIMAHEDLDAALIIAEYLAVAEAFFDKAEGGLVHAVLDRLNKAIRLETQ